ncbi:MAG: AAA family ATPase [Myxococcales bacterium]|jgi:type II secretory pathway predicted ATPase ExeA|nr:AAA family ATPase [Myxococcales bacterium]
MTTHLAFFHLVEEPFSNLPDPRFFCACPEHTAAIEACLAALDAAPGRCLLTADPGMGKTLLARHCGQALDSDRWQAFHLLVPNAALTPRGLLRRLCALLSDGVNAPRESTADELFARLAQRLDAIASLGKRPALIVDEAQMLEVPETLALLGALPRLSLLLVGLAGCEEKLTRGLGLDRPILHRLSPLSPASVATYVQHRMARADASAQPFAPEAIEALHRHSGGVPRRLNLLCDAALIEAARQSRANIDAAMIERIAARVGTEERPLSIGDLTAVDRFLDRLLEG